MQRHWKGNEEETKIKHWGSLSLSSNVFCKQKKMNEEKPTELWMKIVSRTNLTIIIRGSYNCKWINNEDECWMKQHQQ